MIAYLANYTTPPPTPGPGAYSYSNIGGGLLGYTLELVYGTPWERLLEDVITAHDVLHMPDTACLLTPELAARTVQAYMPTWQAESEVRFFATCTPCIAST